MAPSGFIERMLEHLPAIITVSIMSAILIKFVWKSKQKKRNFSEKSVFITSCDTALGFEIARKLDKLGFTVFAGFMMADGEAALRLKGKTSNRLKTIEIDVTDDDQVVKAVDYVEHILETPGLYCLINTANITLSGSFQWYTASQCQRLMDVNIVGTIRAIKYFLPLLKLEKGRIINVAGTSSRFDYPWLSIQSASKSAVIRFSKLLHEELIETGVSVSSVEHEDGQPFTINLTEKEEINEMRLHMNDELRDKEMEEMYQWHRAQDAKSKRSIKAESDFLRLELELVENAVTSHIPQMIYSPFSCSQRITALLLQFLPRCIKSQIMKIFRK